jgi:predicted molibdopterin-dependent oxidoreductase YjgC
MVEIKPPGRDPRLVAACIYPCEDNLVVKTDNERVRHSRRMTVELLLAGAYDTPEILALSEELGSQDVRFKLPEEHACVLCGQCVRACVQIVGVSAISVINRGIRKKVSTPFEIASSRCIGCGTCALICPTGAIKISDITGIHYVPPNESAYKLGYYRTGGELDLRPNFVEDLTPLLGKHSGNGGDHE